jgi:hypothetical protein
MKRRALGDFAVTIDKESDLVKEQLRLNAGVIEVNDESSARLAKAGK